MEINCEWLDTQEPGPYVVAVQEAWDKVPTYWTRLLPQKSILFLVSPGAEAEVYNSKESIGQDARILIIIPEDYDYEQVLKSSLLVLAYAFAQMNCVQEVLQSVLYALVEHFDFTEEEKAFVYDPDFGIQMFLSCFIAHALGLFNPESAHEFAWEFIHHVNTEVKVLKGGA